MHDDMESVARLREMQEGCQNCYMYFLDRVRDKSGSDIYKTKSDLTILCKKTVTVIIKCRVVSLFAYV